MKDNLMKRGCLAATATAVVALATACATETAGEPISTPDTAPTDVTAPPSSAPNPGSPFAGIAACGLLDQALKGMGFPPGKLSTAASDNGCGTSKAQEVDVALYLMTEYSIDDYGSDSTKLHDGKINGRRAVQMRADRGIEGTCDIAMAVSPQAFALVGVTDTDNSTEAACEVVSKVAHKVEPLLPDVN